VIAVIGVGNMGGAMAANLLDKGWPVRVYDLDGAKCLALARLGALMCASAADAARAATTTIICVVDAAQTVEVLFGAGGVADAMQLGHSVMVCPTMAPEEVEDIALRLRPFGLHCVDAPMSGGPVRARDGSMSLMVACAPNVLERQRALIDALASRVFHISERIGDGARTKLVNNLAAGINLIAAAEVLAMATRLGLDAARTLDVMEQSSGQSWIGSDRMRRAIAGDLTPRAHMTLLEKDTRLAVRVALEAGFEGPLGAAACDVFAKAAAAGLAESDDAALLEWLEHKPRTQMADTPVRPPV
jgi:putative dehydrogenase